MANAAYDRRKTAILTGLRAALGDPLAIDALAVWERDYAPTRPLAIVDFVADLERQHESVSGNGGAVRLALYQALIKHDATRGRTAALRDEQPVTKTASAASAPAAAPATTEAAAEATPKVTHKAARTATIKGGQPAAPAVGSLDVSGQSGVKPTPRESAAFTVFSALAEAIRAGVEESGPNARREFSIALARLTPAGLASVDIWSGWLAGRSLAALRDANDSQLADALHIVYVAAAESIGPVLADRLLSRAIDAAKALPAARAFAPSRLL